MHIIDLVAERPLIWTMFLAYLVAIGGIVASLGAAFAGT